MQINPLKIFLIILIVLLTSHTGPTGPAAEKPQELCVLQQLDVYTYSLYRQLEVETRQSAGKIQPPDYPAFKRAITGFMSLRAIKGTGSNLLTIIDFSISSNKERLWIIDLHSMKILHSSLVAHGRNSGEEYAKHFSNVMSSYKSSLGFFLTGSIYKGQHGISLYLDGVEPGINDLARKRSIVMHSASYVSNEFINNFGRLGRSLGCPAIPVDNHESVLRMLEGNACIYIHHNCQEYINASVLLSPETAIKGLNLFLSDRPEGTLAIQEVHLR